MLMKKLHASKLTSLAALVAIALGSTAYATQYTVTPLEMLGGTSTTVTGINSTGELVGYVTPSTGNDNAFLYNNGAMTDLNITGASNSYATAINSLGQIVVAEEPGSPGSPYYNYIYNSGSLSEASGPLRSDNINGLNSSGQVVGQTSSAYAYIYQNGTLQNIAPYNSSAAAINATGEVVGSYYSNVNNVGTNHAFLYANGVFQSLFPNTVNSTASGINSSGQVVGYSTDSAGNTYAFLYNNGSVTNLGTLGGTYSEAYGINSLGQIVGQSTDSAGNTYGFLYSNGVMQNLNSLIGSASFEYKLTDPVGINKNGQIAVNGTITATGQNMGFLLTPVTSTSSAGVPAPATLGLLAAAMAGLLLMRRKQIRSLS